MLHTFEHTWHPWHIWTYLKTTSKYIKRNLLSKKHSRERWEWDRFFQWRSLRCTYPHLAPHRTDICILVISLSYLQLTRRMKIKLNLIWSNSSFNLQACKSQRGTILNLPTINRSTQIVFLSISLKAFQVFFSYKRIKKHFEDFLKVSSESIIIKCHILVKHISFLGKI